MSAQPDDGGPAFPVSDLSKTQCPGMSLRDWLAGQAMNGLVSSSWGGLQKMETFSRMSYEFADAMIAARKGGIHD